MNIKILEGIGLTKGEIKVYISLVNIGPSTSGPITNSSEVSRSKVYNILERLIKKGLVSYIIKEKTKYFQAEDPIKLKDYMNEREREIIEQKEQVKELISELQLKKDIGKNLNEAQIYKGFKGIQIVHEHMYLRLKKGDEFYYFGIPAFQKESHHIYWEKDHKKREKLGIKSRALFNQKTDKKILRNRNKFKLSEARYMPISIETPSWIMGYLDVTVIGLQSDEGMAIEINNQKIADSFRQYFESFWELSKPFK